MPGYPQKGEDEATDGVMDRIDVRPPVDWRAMTREEKLAWARAIVEETRVAYEAEPEPTSPG